MSTSFRTEFARLVAALTRLFGVHNLALAEDVAQDTLCRALEVWKLRGEPADPTAWLVAAAKNRAIDVLRRERTSRRFAPELGRLLESEWAMRPLVDESFEPGAIADEELRMMFSCCAPELAPEVQLALVLNVCCGFAAPEIAQACLESTAAIEKRLARGKKALAELFVLQGDVSERLGAVQRALYLVFNEGYHGSGAIRAEFCRDAIRLTCQLLAHPLGDVPSSRALLALFCLHAARLPARADANGELVGFAEQDRASWDAELLERGQRALEAACEGDELTAYHLEAMIAAVHARAPSARETDWARIVELYDLLLRLKPSPVVELNRAIAVAELHGPQAGLDALEAIAQPRLQGYPFLAAARGELLQRLGQHEEARAEFRRAAKLARSEPERRFFEGRAARAK